MMRAIKMFLWLMTLAIVLVLAWPIQDVLRSQVALYPVTTMENGSLLTANRSVYKVFPQTQTVIHWMPDLSGVPDRLADCSVRDRLNWHCRYSDGSGELIMQNGVLKATADTLRKPFITYTNRLNWWRHRLL